MKLGIKALAIGTLVTFSSFGASWAASTTSLLWFAHFLYWQGWWLQTFLPCLNVGSPANPICEGTPLNLVVFVLGLPFGVILYSLVAYVALSIRQRLSA